MAPRNAQQKHKSLNDLSEESRIHRVQRGRVERSSNPIKPPPAQAEAHIRIQTLCGRQPGDVIDKDFYPCRVEKENGITRYRAIMKRANWPDEILHGILKLAEQGFTATKIRNLVHDQICLRMAGRGRGKDCSEVQGVTASDLEEALNATQASGHQEHGDTVGRMLCINLPPGVQGVSLKFHE